MPQGAGKKEAGSRGRRKLVQLPAVASATIQASQYGYVVYPSAQKLIKQEILKAVKVGTIEPESAHLGASALVAAGIEAVRHRGGPARVTVADIREGWTQYVSIGPPNHPIHRCIQRSVVTRVGELEAKSDVFSEFLGKKAR